MRAGMRDRDSEYLHGTAPEEQQRLSRLNDILNEASLAELRLKGGEKILDVGCGLAQFTRAMARVTGPQGRVIGVERSPEQIAEAERQALAQGEGNLVELRQGDALALPLRDEEWGTFDVAHARFLLEHVPDPLRVVRVMVRTVHAGGRVVLADDDHDVIRLWPEPAGFQPLWNAYFRVYERLGNDPYVGRHLVSLLHRAGAAPARNTWIFFGSCSGDPNFALYVDNMLGLLHGAREKIMTWALLDPTLFDQGIAALDAWKHRPDAALWFAMCWAEGIRRC
jgi:ubiquinone/menaquinone biosynthesis C-methylase UbiE